MGKYGPEKLRIWTFFTYWFLELFTYLWNEFQSEVHDMKICLFQSEDLNESDRYWNSSFWSFFAFWWSSTYLFMTKISTLRLMIFFLCNNVAHKVQTIPTTKWIIAIKRKIYNYNTINHWRFLKVKQQLIRNWFFLEMYGYYPS